MTAVNWWLQANGVMVLTDTLLGSAREGESMSDALPAAFVQKAFPIAHLGAIVSGRGDGDLIAAFASTAATRVLARDFDDLCDQIPGLIRELVIQCDIRRGFQYGGTTSIFVWGLSPEAGRVVGLTYRSPVNFKPEAMQDGAVCAPTIDADQTDIRAAFKGSNIPAALVAVMRRQHLEARRVSNDPDQNRVGGEVMLTTLTVEDDGEAEISARRLFRFEDYEGDYAIALSRIDAEPLASVVR